MPRFLSFPQWNSLFVLAQCLSRMRHPCHALCGKSGIKHQTPSHHHHEKRLHQAPRERRYPSPAQRAGYRIGRRNPRAENPNYRRTFAQPEGAEAFRPLNRSKQKERLQPRPVSYPPRPWGYPTISSFHHDKGVYATFARVVVITTTLTSTSTVPNTVRNPSPSPPRKYPTTTATTGFTYAYVPTFVGDS